MRDWLDKLEKDKPQPAKDTTISTVAAGGVDGAKAKSDGQKAHCGRKGKWVQFHTLVENILTYADEHSQEETARYFSARCEKETGEGLTRNMVKNLKKSQKVNGLIQIKMMSYVQRIAICLLLYGFP